jgi:hypothetical protein
VHLPVGASARHVREVLGLHAEFGGWELAHHAVWTDGRRKITVRRRLRPSSTASDLSGPESALAS